MTYASFYGNDFGIDVIAESNQYLADMYARESAMILGFDCEEIATEGEKFENLKQKAGELKASVGEKLASLKESVKQRLTSLLEKAQGAGKDFLNFVQKTWTGLKGHVSKAAATVKDFAAGVAGLAKGGAAGAKKGARDGYYESKAQRFMAEDSFFGEFDDVMFALEAGIDEIMNKSKHEAATLTAQRIEADMRKPGHITSKDEVAKLDEAHATMKELEQSVQEMVERQVNKAPDNVGRTGAAPFDHSKAASVASSTVDSMIGACSKIVYAGVQAGETAAKADNKGLFAKVAAFVGAVLAFIVAVITAPFKAIGKKFGKEKTA